MSEQSSIYVLRYRDLLSMPVASELDALVASINATVGAEHDVSTGAHTDITIESLTARTDYIKLLSSLQWRSGAFLVDPPGNSTHVGGLRQTLTADQNNWNPTGFATALAIEVDSDADRTITGLQRTQGRAKRVLLFGNRGNYNITLKQNSASSTAENRFGHVSSLDVVVPPEGYIWIWYDAGSENWRTVKV